jgi:hypothetical protein
MYHHLPVKDTTERFTLLCIRSHQVSFEKDDLNWYGAPRTALTRGYAVESEWKASPLLDTLPPFPRMPPRN